MQTAVVNYPVRVKKLLLSSPSSKISISNFYCALFTVLNLLRVINVFAFCFFAYVLYLRNSVLLKEQR